MANKTLTPLDVWSDPKSPVNGDAPDMAYDEACHQRHANRTHWLNERRKASISSSADDSIASVAGPFTGDTNWHDCAAVSKTITGTVGDTVPFLLTASATMNSSPGNATVVRLKCVDNGVTEYLDGSAQLVLADAGVHRVVFAGKHTLASTTAVLTLQVQNNNNAVSIEICGGWSIVTL